MVSIKKNLKVKIVDASPEEIEFLRENFRRYPVRKAGPDVKTLIAKAGGKIVGYLQIDESKPSFAKIRALEVLKEMRGKRVGSTLVGKANSYLLNKKVNGVVANPDIETGSVLFWRKTNYQPAGGVLDWFWIPKPAKRDQSRILKRKIK